MLMYGRRKTPSSGELMLRPHLREETRRGGAADDGAPLFKSGPGKLVFFIGIICLSWLVLLAAPTGAFITRRLPDANKVPINLYASFVSIWVFYGTSPLKMMQLRVFVPSWRGSSPGS